ncbi:hypothetical protein NMG60_11023454 [Bertholletia excelsa]
MPSLMTKTRQEASQVIQSEKLQRQETIRNNKVGFLSNTKNAMSARPKAIPNRLRTLDNKVGRCNSDEEGSNYRHYEESEVAIERKHVKAIYGGRLNRKRQVS